MDTLLNRSRIILLLGCISLISLLTISCQQNTDVYGGLILKSKYTEDNRLTDGPLYTVYELKPAKRGQYVLKIFGKDVTKKGKVIDVYKKQDISLQINLSVDKKDHINEKISIVPLYLKNDKKNKVEKNVLKIEKDYKADTDDLIIIKLDKIGSWIPYERKWEFIE